MSTASTTDIGGGIFADYASVQDYLFSLKAGGVKFGIDRMRAWGGALGHPELATPVVHIAGTNGKGSTAAMLDAIFREAGLRAGLYTSPHLVMLGERVQVNRAPLSPAEIISFTNRLRPVAEAVSRGNPDAHPSFFEFMTAMAFLQFEREKCDVCIIETGLGGRLDATNVVAPAVSVITSVGLDHCEMLGGTIGEIAFEKAGIIKPGSPVVLGHVPAAAEAVVRRVAGALGAEVRSVAEEFGADAGGANYPKTNLEGEHQRRNAAAATLAARVLAAAPGARGGNARETRWRLDGGVIERGLSRVDWPGRWQRITTGGGQRLILDAAHNPEAAVALDKNLERLRAESGGGGAGGPAIVIGALGEARARALLGVAARHARELHLVVPRQARACSHAELEALVPRGFGGKVFRATVGELFPAPGCCAISDPRAPVVVTGSIYLLGEVMERLRGGAKGEGWLQDF